MLIKPTRILFLDHAASLGGAENSLLLLLRNLSLEAWQPELAVVPGQFLIAAKNEGYSVHPVSYPRLRNSPGFLQELWKQSRNLAQLANQLDIQLFHSNTIRSTIYGSLAAKIAKRPFIWHMRDFWLSEDEPQQKWMDTYGKWILSRMATKIITNSQATANHLYATPKIDVVHNGIDLTEFDLAEDGCIFRQQYNIAPSQPVIGMIGRLRPWKGQTTFLHMAAQLKQAQPDCHFIIVGGSTFDVQDNYPQQLENLTQQLKLNNCVTFTGPLTDVQSALSAMDVFVHPGEPEPFGLVNIEAMAMQKPVVAFAHGALPEIVVDGQTGLLVPPHDIGALATAVLSLLNDLTKREKMGKQGRARVTEKFTIEQTTKQISNIYQELI